MNDTPSTPPPPSVPDDETRPFGAGSGGRQTLERDPEPPVGYPAYQGPPAYAGYPPPERPRFGDQVLGMRAVIAVALVALLIGGLGGALLGSLSDHGGDDGRFGGPGGGFPPGGVGQGQLPGQGQPGQLPGQGQGPGQGQLPNQQLQPTRP